MKKTTLVWTMILFTLSLSIGLPHTAAEDPTNSPDGPLLVVEQGLSPENITYSPDGTLLAVEHGFGIDLYDTEALQTHAQLDVHNLTSFSFSPDGKTIATGSWDRTVRLWDVATATQKGTLTEHIGRVTSVSFSPDGRTIASGSWGEVRLWDVATATQKGTLIGHTDWVNSVSFSPDGKTIASWSGDGEVRLWDVATATPKGTLTGHTGKIWSFSFSPDGKTIATGGGDKTVRLWDVATGALKHTLTGHTGGVNSVAFSPDGKTIASGDGTVRLWDVATGALKHTLTGHTRGVNSFSFSPDGKTIATGGGDKTVRLWDVATGALKHTLTGHTRGVSSVAFSPNGRTIASINWREALLWDLILYLDITPEPPDTVDIPGPTIAIRTPSAAQILDHSTPVITGNFSGAAPIAVALSINGEAVVAEVSDNAFTYTPADALGNGEYTLVAVATDVNGKTAEANVTFTVDIPGPTVTILTPSAGQILDHGTPVITGEFSGAATPISLSLTLNDAVIEAEVSDNAFTYTPADALGNGEHTLVAVATDVNGKTAEANVTFSIKRVYPAWDVNEDGHVNVLDLVLVGQNIGGSIAAVPRADVNGDGSINVLDLVLVAGHFGE